MSAQAEKLWAAAQKAAEVLAATGAPHQSISLGATASEELVEEFAQLAGAEVRRHATFSGSGPASTIYATSAYVEGVEVRIQGSRPATAEEWVTANVWVGIRPATDEERRAALEGVSRG
jgi:hypothetical protein